MSREDDFVKVYGSILDSSIWLEPDGTRLLWLTMLCMADPWSGVVTASIGGLAARARISREACVAGLETLSSPDLDSKNQDNEGRRIEKVEGGWRILNHELYRNRRTRQQEQTTERVRRYRARKAELEAQAAADPEPKPKAKDRPAKFDPLTVPIPEELKSPAFADEWAAFVGYRRRLGKPFKTENGPAAALRHLAPLGPERAVQALQITREKEWQGVEHGIAELERRSPAPVTAPTPARAARSAAEGLELERRRVVAEAFARKGLTPEARDSIVEAANRATCLEDLERILWP